MVSGTLASLAGLLVAAVRLAVRRRNELAVLQARGASTSQVVGQLMVESVWVVVPAAVAASVACWQIVESAGPVSVARLVAVLAVLLLLSAVGSAEVRAARPPASIDPPVRSAATPARTTAEVAVVAAAALGALLLKQRTLTTAGVDPYLSTVPALVAVAAGVVAPRLHVWPMRILTTLVQRRRGATAFVGFASSRTAASGGAWAPLVMVLAIAAGASAGIILAAAAAARDTAAVQEIDAHVRVTDTAPGDLLRSDLWPPAADFAGAVSDVAAVPGIDVVAAVGGSGRLFSEGTVIQNVDVVSVDAPAYERILEAVGSSVRLPSAVTTADPATDPLPVLAPPNLADREHLVVQIGAERRPVVPVGDVAGLPGLERRGPWVLVPRQALASPGPADGLMISGPAADPEEVRAAVGNAVDGGGDLTVTTLAQVRDRIERTGFNNGLTLLLRVGVVGATLCVVLVVCVMLAAQVRDPGRALAPLYAMGMSPGQMRALTLIEIAPVAILATAVGTLVGAAIPLLLDDALTSTAPLW